MANVAAHFAESEAQAPESIRRPRCEQRIASAFRVEVCGFNRYGRFFTERTLTSNITTAAASSRCMSKWRRIQS